MPSKAQITGFIIVGLVILAVVGMGWYAYTLTTERKQASAVTAQSDFTEFAKQTQNSIELCAEQVIQNTVSDYAKGAVGVSEGLALDDITVRRLYSGGSRIILTEDDAQTVLSQAIIARLPQCLSTVENSVDIKTVSPHTTVLIQNDDIRVQVQWPLVLSTEDQQKTLEQFSVTVPSALRETIAAANQAAALVEQYRYSSPILDPLQIGAQDVQVVRINGELVYVIHMQTTGAHDLYFAFSLEPQSRFQGNPPTLDAPEEIVMQEGERVQAQLSATDPDGDELRFYSLCPFLLVDELTGAIDFTPSGIFAGEHLCTVGVIDSQFLSAEKDIRLAIAAAMKPLVLRVENKTIMEGKPWTYTPFVSPRSSTSEYYLSVEPEPSSRVEVFANGSIEWKNPVKGSYRVTFFAANGEQETNASFTLNVQSPEPPVLFVTDQIGTTGLPFTYPITVVSMQSYTTELVSGAQGMKLENNLLTWEEPYAGTYVVTVRATADGQTSDGTFTVTIP